MYLIETGQSPVAMVDTCLVATEDICPVSPMPPAAAGCHGPNGCQKSMSFCSFEFETPYSDRVGRRSVSPSIYFYNNFSPPSSARSPPNPSLGLLKIHQNPFSASTVWGILARHQKWRSGGICSRKQPHATSPYSHQTVVTVLR